MREELANLLREYRPDFDADRDFFNDTPEVQGSLEDLASFAQLEAARRLDPSVRSMYLMQVRVSGGAIQDGVLDQKTQTDVILPFMKEIQAVGTGGELVLAGLGAGSLVLLFVPSEPQVAPQGSLPGTKSQLDEAVRLVQGLHRSFESQANAADIRPTPVAVLKEARRLVRNLDRLSVELSSAWWTPDVDQPDSAQLTQQGVGHALSLFRDMPQVTEEYISGTVAALDILGHLTVRLDKSSRRRLGRRRSKMKLRVIDDAFDITQLKLGAPIALIVEEETKSRVFDFADESEFRLVTILEPTDRMIGDDAD